MIKPQMQARLRRLFLLPTWLLMRVLRGTFPGGHPWRQRPPSWPEWVAHATPLCEVFGAGLWGTLLPALAVLILLLTGGLR